VDEPTVVVGLITKAHGLRGEVAVQNRSDNPDRWTPGEQVLTEDGRTLTIEHTRGGVRLLVRFAEVVDRAQAERLRGTLLVVPASWLPELPDGQYWPHQLEGCEVVTETGRRLGTVTDVIANPANDLWVTVDANGTETLIPAITEVVIEVDVGGQRITVRDVPGLTMPDRS
jgi:16S rRNA processing protein RimM